MFFLTKWVILYGLFIGGIQFLIFAPIFKGDLYFFVTIPISLILSVILYRKDNISTTKKKILNSIVLFVLGNIQILYGIYTLLMFILYIE